MSNYKTNREYEKMDAYGKSLAVDNHIMGRAGGEMDKAIYLANVMEDKLDNDIAIKRKLLEYLTKGKTVGLSENDKKEILLLNQKLQENKLKDAPKLNVVESQNIHKSFDEMHRDNLQYAEKYSIDLSNPIIAALSEKERIEVNKSLKEKFNLLELDDFDYAFAAAVGAIGGLIDSLFVGTATNDVSKQSALSKMTDEKIGDMVQKYAKIRGWKAPGNEGANSLKSAIGHLERSAEVKYDQRYKKDFKGLDFMKGMNTKNHHLLSLGHSCGLLGLVVGVIDMLQGKATFWDNAAGKLVRVKTGSPGDVNGVTSAVIRWLDHIMSDVSGASGSQGRGAGLPTGFQSVLQSVKLGAINVDGDTLSIGQLVEKMYVNGYDFRFAVTTTIPVIITEVSIRMWWMIKQYFYHGKTFKESIPFGENRGLQRLLLVVSGTFVAVDVTDAAIRSVAQNNTLIFFNSLNYAQLANLGYKTFVNVKLQHEHNKNVRGIIEKELNDKLKELENCDYTFCY